MVFGRNHNARKQGGFTTVTTNTTTTTTEPIEPQYGYNADGTRATHAAKPSLMTRMRARREQKALARNNGAATTTTTGATTGTKRPSRFGGVGRRSRVSNSTTTGATTTAAPVRRQQRKPGVGDKLSGAMMKMKGSVTHRPGEKAAGTRRMRGTDGRGTRRVY